MRSNRRVRGHRPINEGNALSPQGLPSANNIRRPRGPEQELQRLWGESSATPAILPAASSGEADRSVWPCAQKIRRTGPPCDTLRPRLECLALVCTPFALPSTARQCIDMCVGIGTGTSLGMGGKDMCLHMCIDARVDTYVNVCTGKCMSMCARMCMHSAAFHDGGAGSQFVRHKLLARITHACRYRIHQ